MKKLLFTLAETIHFFSPLLIIILACSFYLLRPVNKPVKIQPESPPNQYDTSFSGENEICTTGRDLLLSGPLYKLN